MSKRDFADSHNMVAFLEKPKEAEGYTEVVDFLNATSIRYALTVNPTVYVSHIKQFWSTAKITTIDGEERITAKVDGQEIVVNEASIRETLLLGDDEEIECLENEAIFEGLESMGYEKKNDNLRFYKALFSTQWKFLIHTILHCLSPKTGGWNEFGATQASALICLATGKPFNFSKMILDGLKKNISSNCFVYPRFLQLIMDKQFSKKKVNKREFSKKKVNKKVFESPMLGKKAFANMRRNGKDFSGKVTPLFPYMLSLAQNQGAEGAGNQTVTPSSSQPKKTYTLRSSQSKGTELPQASAGMDGDGAVHKGRGHRMVRARAATTVSGLEARQDSGNISKTQPMATSNELSSHELDSGDGIPSHMENIGGVDAQISSEATLNLSKDPLLGLGNTSRSGEDSMELIKELMEKCTTLSKQVLDLQLLTSAQDGEIKALQKRVKILEGVKRSRAQKLKRSKKVGTAKRVESSVAEEVAPNHGGNNAEGMGSGEDTGVDMEMDMGNGVESEENEFVVADTNGNEVVLEEVVVMNVDETQKEQRIDAEKMVEATKITPETAKSLGDVTTAPTVTLFGVTLFAAATTATTAEPDVMDDDGILAQAMVELKTSKPELKAAKPSVVIREPSTTPKKTAQPQPPQYKGKGKAILTEVPEFAEENQAAVLEQQRKEVEAKTLALIDAWDEERAKCDADWELTKKLTQEDQEQYSIDQRAKFLKELIDERRKFYAAERLKKKMQKPPTRKQRRNYQCDYLKNMKGYKLNSLARIDDGKIQEMYESAKREMGKFVPMETEELAEKEKEVSSCGVKRAGGVLKSIGAKKQKVVEQVQADTEQETEQNEQEQKADDDNDKEHMQAHTKLASVNEEEVIDAVPLSVKLPFIAVTFGFQGKTAYWDIKRADGRSVRFISFLQMVQYFDREDMVTLWKLYKDKFGYNRPEQIYERVIWNYLKVMFEPHPEDKEWISLRHNTVQQWKLFQSCGVHVLDADGVTVYMLVEKDYPIKFNKEVVHQMLNAKKRLQLQYPYDDMAYQLLRKMQSILTSNANRQD